LSNGRRYLIVSPSRDEAKYMRRTLDSVAAQSVLPACWVVIDDGSTDDTPRILAEYAARLPFLRVVRRYDRGARSVGPGVIEAFYFGLEQVRRDDYDYLCKLDMDLEFPPRYFETLMARMERDPRLGSTSGKPWFHHPVTGVFTPETIGNEMSVGASKFYRTDCFREIGGFVRQVMWDGIDCHRARMLGWKVESVDEEPLRFLHLRPMGSSQGRGIWAGRVRNGFGQYFMGTSPVFLLASAIYRLPHHPVVTGSVAMVWGYVSSALRGVPRYGDARFRRFLRRYQRESLFLGKAAAARRVEERQAAVWYAKHPAVAEASASGRRAAGT
jgi:glycosyltransferase involved in cell wall biosynthesis